MLFGFSGYDHDPELDREAEAEKLLIEGGFFDAHEDGQCSCSVGVPCIAHQWNEGDLSNWDVIEKLSNLL